MSISHGGNWNKSASPYNNWTECVKNVLKYKTNLALNYCCARRKTQKENTPLTFKKVMYASAA